MNRPEAARRAGIEHSLLNMEREQPNTKAYEAMGEPRHMTAFWDIGLCELSDFTDFQGTRILTYSELKSSGTKGAVSQVGIGHPSHSCANTWGARRVEH